MTRLCVLLLTLTVDCQSKYVVGSAEPFPVACLTMHYYFDVVSGTFSHKQFY